MQFGWLDSEEGELILPLHYKKETMGRAGRGAKARARRRGLMCQILRRDVL